MDFRALDLIGCSSVHQLGNDMVAAPGIDPLGRAEGGLLISMEEEFELFSISPLLLSVLILPQQTRLFA